MILQGFPLGAHDLWEGFHGQIPSRLLSSAEKGSMASQLHLPGRQASGAKCRVFANPCVGQSSHSLARSSGHRRVKIRPVCFSSRSLPTYSSQSLVPWNCASACVTPSGISLFLRKALSFNIRVSCLIWEAFTDLSRQSYLLLCPVEP